MNTEIRHTRKQYMTLCYIQCALRTLGLYKGNIDGWFGKDSFDAFEKLTGSEVSRPGGWYSRDIFFTLQREMTAAGQGVAMDGVWGEESQKAFYTLVKRYRRRHQCMEYGPAWSRRMEISEQNWADMRRWLNWNNLPETHLHYLASVIAFETDEKFYYTVKEVGKILRLEYFLTAYFRILATHKNPTEYQTFDHYALVGTDGYPVKEESRKQYDDAIVINPVGVADSYLWAGLHPINRNVAHPDNLI